MVAVFFFLSFVLSFLLLCVNVFGQVTCDATGQVLCLGPEYRAKLSIVLLHPPLLVLRCALCALVETPHTKEDLTTQELLVWGSIFSKCVFSGCFSTRWQPVAQTNWIKDNAEKKKKKGDKKCHVSRLLQFTTRFCLFFSPRNNADLECWGNIGLM